jgi:hypothetical protein
METQLHPRFKLVIVLIMLGISLAFWNSIVLYPVKVFVVLLHELSHGLAAVVTGGSIVKIEINERIGGACYTTGGWQFLVVSAGYVGSMILGGILFMLAQRSTMSRWLSVGIGSMCVLVTVLFVRTLFGLVFGIVFGAALFAASRYLPSNFLELVLQYLGGMSCIYSLVDVKEDLLTTRAGLTDAVILAQMTHIPAIVWGIFWSLLSLAVLLAVAYATYRKHAMPAAATRQAP